MEALRLTKTAGLAGLLRIASSVLVILLFLSCHVFAAQGRPAETRAHEIGQQVNQLSETDADAARALAWKTSLEFRKDGQSFLAGRFGLQALKLDAMVGNWDRAARDGLAVQEYLDKELDREELAVFYNLLLNAVGATGDRATQTRLMEGYITRAAALAGKGSVFETMARIFGAYSFLQTGDIDTGLPRLQAALKYAAAGKNHGLTLDEYRRAGQSFADSGQTETAKAFFTEGLGTTAAKKESRELATLWFEYSRFLTKSGDDIDTSIDAARMARELLDRQFGKTSEQAIAGGDNLASLLVANGAVASGLNIQEEVYTTALASLGENAPLTWRTANNFAEALRMVDHPEVARGIDEFLLKVRIAHYGRASIQALVSASNLGLDLLALGDKEGALKAFEEQRQIGEALADPTSEHAAQGEKWKAYADAYFSRNARLDNASLAAMAAIKDWRSAPDLMRVKTAQLAAEQFEMRDDTNQALALREEAYDISGKAFGELHPITFDAALEVATAHLRRNDTKTLESFEQLDEKMFSWMLREVGSSGNRYVAETTRRLADDMLLAFGEFAQSNPQAASAYANAVTRWKSMESGERTRLRMAAETITDPNLKRLTEKVVRLMGQQQELLSSGDVDSDISKMLAELKASREQLPASLVQGGTPDTIEDTLAPDAVMIDFFVNSRRTRNGDDKSDDARLEAIIRQRDHVPTIVNLGSLSAIMAQAGAEEDVEQRFAKLYAGLFGPLESVIAGKKQLYIVLDAALYSIPFSVMKTPDGRYLDEAFQLHFLTRADAIFFAEKRDRPAAGESALIVGDLSYRNETPLPFTRDEMRDVADNLGEAGMAVQSLRGRKGDEASIRRASTDASIVHLATHGFFNEENGPDAVDALWRSGLIVAGAQNAKKPGISDKDGTLYARELMTWDLSSVDLVVLSACQTAQGDPSRLGNVRGLPTALAIAGARRSLLALWDVNDEGTANFMAYYYRVLSKEKLDYAAALRKTRIAAMKGEINKAEDPSLWAAFVLFEG
jgi:CHAT domain-containing protein/tetratricopeptide (TPR) repeat protein